MVVVQETETLGVLTGYTYAGSGVTALDDGHGYLPAPALAVSNSFSQLPIAMVAAALPRTLMKTRPR
ncbi:hypothetical protein [Streptomyces sp. SAI-127]|uniref:hypothetical protein n=1 Tax=Streptomyces sp. SAI-127 TaxID=2940543 RepID=UPI002476CAA8|nr:hypothetical protein [Streptomyces sp. SAI-127]MDH6484715.1 hypothetical protein [Streptomyces sp. SAI-127]